MKKILVKIILEKEVFVEYNDIMELSHASVTYPLQSIGTLTTLIYAPQIELSCLSYRLSFIKVSCTKYFAARSRVRDCYAPETNWCTLLHASLQARRYTGRSTSGVPVHVVASPIARPGNKSVIK